MAVDLRSATPARNLAIELLNSLARMTTVSRCFDLRFPNLTVATCLVAMFARKHERTTSRRCFSPCQILGFIRTWRTPNLVPEPGCIHRGPCNNDNTAFHRAGVQRVPSPLPLAVAYFFQDTNPRSSLRRFTSHLNQPPHVDLDSAAMVRAAPLLTLGVVGLFLSTALLCLDSDVSLAAPGLLPSGEDYFRGKVVWVTGASSGIGKALAEHLSAKGARLILSSRRHAALEGVRLSLPDPASAVSLAFDLSDTSSLNDTAAKAWDTYGHIDVLVNNAGLNLVAAAETVDLSVFDKVLQVDLMGPLHLTRHILPRMLRRRTPAHIVAVSSAAGKIGVPFRSAYSAAKHGLHGYFDAVRVETAGTNVSVTILVPGYVRTDGDINTLDASGKRSGKRDPGIQNGTPAGRLSLFDGAKHKRQIWSLALCSHPNLSLSRRRGDGRAICHARRSRHCPPAV